MKSAKAHPVTVWGSPTETFNSQYGTVSYVQWCQAEIRRINQNGGDVKLAHDDKGQIAVVRAS